VYRISASAHCACPLPTDIDRDALFTKQQQAGCDLYQNHRNMLQFGWIRPSQWANDAKMDPVREIGANVGQDDHLLDRDQLAKMRHV
jgi:hypothetical protein